MGGKKWPWADKEIYGWQGKKWIKHQPRAAKK